MELLFVTLGGVILGLAARYALPNRLMHGSVLVPAIGGAVAAVVWVALTWLGLPWDGGLIWLLTLIVTGVLVFAVDPVIGRRRAVKDDALLADMVAGRVQPTVQA